MFSCDSHILSYELYIEIFDVFVSVLNYNTFLS